MKQALIFLTLVFLTACSSRTAESQKTAGGEAVSPPAAPVAAKQFVLVELYTSEG